MKNQLEHWNNAHKQQWLRAHSEHETAFAKEVNSVMTPHSSILELGCGEGNDSIYFARQGHDIDATDFSDVVIAQNNQRYNDPKLDFWVQDMSQPLAFPDSSYDAVYARLSLHYFPDAVTQKIFKEIARVLKPGGRLAFMCKATSDPIYGKGEKIEADMYELSGHVRHFFSEEYATKLLRGAGLAAKHVETGNEVIYDRRSAFIKVIAQKGADAEI